MKLSEIDIKGFNTLLLDRDGVINKLRPNDYVKSWNEFEFVPGIFEELSRFSKFFKYIFIVTNQRGVGKGLMTEETLQHIHMLMCKEIESHGGRIDKIYYCTATDDNDYRRKPNVGMFEEILKEYPDVKKDNCIMIGDSDSDVQFANNCGIKGVKIQ